MQRLPPLAREAEDWVVAAHPALHQVVQVGRRFCPPSQALHLVAFSGFGSEHLVEADEVGCRQEGAEDRFAEGFEKAGEGEERRGSVRWLGGLAVGESGDHCSGGGGKVLMRCGTRR